MEICSLENKNKTGLDGEAVRRARTLLTERFGARPLALTHFFGCQQNVADGEHLNGILSLLGFGFTDQVQEADLVLFNTCAVRESAEDRVWGHIGALKNEKRRRPSMIIAIGGCMTQRTEVA
ncbi:MAG: tRNA (N6-isopentenyl adenosine(37)-C2)-methylthiotransferase MiaB, partial [Oscillospiraceae bacterium]